MPFISQKNIWFCGVRYEVLNIYLVCEWKLFSADDWSSDCRCHGCVSCVQFSVRIRCDLCSTLSPLLLYSQISIWICESGVCWRFSQSAANGSVWAATWLLKPLLLRHNEHISGEQMEGGRVCEKVQPCCSPLGLIAHKSTCCLYESNENNGLKFLPFLPYFYNHF